MKAAVFARRADRHIVDNLGDAIFGKKARDENIRLRPVNLFVNNPVRAGWAYSEVPALPLIQNRREDTRRIEMGESKTNRSIHSCRPALLSASFR